MKPATHPNYYDVEATCVCGNVILTGSTKENIKIDICSACHPFFSGTQKIIDTEGRVERFKKRYTQATDTKGKSAKKTGKGEKATTSLAELAAAPEEAPAVAAEAPSTESTESSEG
jgi:large subunit ribosomal protein L31